MWDIVNAKRLAELDLPLLYGLATDDSHSYHNIPSDGSEPGRGWVMVLASELTPASLIGALESGRFYASSGVLLENVERTASSLAVSVRPDSGETYSIEFIGTRQDFDPTSEPTMDSLGLERTGNRRYSDSIGATLKTVVGPKAVYDFRGDELYVRARITSSRRHPNSAIAGETERAWTQPIRP